MGEPIGSGEAPNGVASGSAGDGPLGRAAGPDGEPAPDRSAAGIPDGGDGGPAGDIPEALDRDLVEDVPAGLASGSEFLGSVEEVPVGRASGPEFLGSADDVPVGLASGPELLGSVEEVPVGRASGSELLGSAEDVPVGRASGPEFLGSAEEVPVGRASGPEFLGSAEERPARRGSGPEPPAWGPAAEPSLGSAADVPDRRKRALIGSADASELVASARYGSAARAPWRPLGASSACVDAASGVLPRGAGESGHSGAEARRCEPARSARPAREPVGESGVAERDRGDSSGGTFKSSDPAVRLGGPGESVAARRVREARAPIVSDGGGGSAGGTCHADAESSFDRRDPRGESGTGRSGICRVASSSSGARRSGTSIDRSGRASPSCFRPLAGSSAGRSTGWWKSVWSFGPGPSGVNGGSRPNAGSIRAVSIVFFAHVRARVSGWSGNRPSQRSSSPRCQGSRPSSAGAYGCGRTNASGPTCAITADSRTPIGEISAHWMRSTAEHVAFGTVNAAMNAWPESWSGMGSLSSWYNVGTASIMTTCASMSAPTSAVSSARRWRRSGTSSSGAGRSGTRSM